MYSQFPVQVSATKPRSILEAFTAVEFLTLAFIVIMATVSCIFFERVDLTTILTNLGTMTLAIFLCNWISTFSEAKWARALHTFYIVPLVMLVFKTVEKVSYPIHGVDYDRILIAVDRSIFGTDPTVWLYQHLRPAPLVVEILQLCYFSYYFLPVIIAVELFIRRHKVTKADYGNDDLEKFRFAIIYALLGSYICYLILPGIGPRFTLHDFSTIDTELPGVWMATTIRNWLNYGEGIRSTVASIAASQVTRDVFPSGHTEISLLSILLGFKYRSKFRWVIFVFGSGLIISTIFLRYHYVIDVISGALLAIITLYSSEPLARAFRSLKKRLVARINAAS